MSRSGPPGLPGGRRRARFRVPSAAAVFALFAAGLAAATLATIVWASLLVGGLHGGGPPGSAPPTLAPRGGGAAPGPLPYGVAPGYWALGVNHTFPSPGFVARARFRASGAGANSSCLALAAAEAEPLTAAYAPRRGLPQPLPGGAPRAAWRWEGRISRAAFEAVPFILRDRHGCHHCTFVLRYKVLGGRLFADASRRRRDLAGQAWSLEAVEEGMLSALHLFPDLPDADLLVHLGDGAPDGLPLLQPNIDRGAPHAGFAIPARNAWLDALGPVQLAAFTECIEVRYPRGAGRAPRAVWRGSNTDRLIDPMDEGNALDAARSRLHLYGRWYPDLLDAALVDYAQRAFDSPCVESVMPLGRRLPLEDVNRYALALDIDGNGWSDRLRVLALSNTPVLKQATNLSSHWDHLLPPGHALEAFAPDLRDLPARVAALLGEAATYPARLTAMAERRQGIAAAVLAQVPVIEAMAYAMATAAGLSDWAPAMEPGYEPVPFGRCCTRARALPRAFVEAVRATGRVRGEVAAAGNSGGAAGD